MPAERIDGIFDSSGGGFTRLEQVVEVITQCAQLISLHAHCLEWLCLAINDCKNIPESSPLLRTFRPRGLRRLRRLRFREGGDAGV